MGKKDIKKKVVDDVIVIAKEISKTEEYTVLVGYYETVVAVLNWLIKMTDAEFTSGELNQPEIDGYDEAYFLEYDGEEIWVGKAYDENFHKYLYFEVDNAYVEEDFYDQYAKSNSTHNVIVFGFDDVNDDKAEDDGVSICMDDDECGFCFCIDNDVAHTKFKYRGNKKLTQEMVSNIINEYVF